MSQARTSQLVAHLFKVAPEIKDLLLESFYNQAIRPIVTAPGFRKGVVPKQVYDQISKPDQVYRKPIEYLVRKKLSESNVRLCFVTQLKVVAGFEKAGTAMEFQVSGFLEPTPKFNKFNLNDIPAYIVPVVSGEDVDNAISQLMSRMSLMEAVGTVTPQTEYTVDIILEKDGLEKVRYGSQNYVPNQDIRSLASPFHSVILGHKVGDEIKAPFTEEIAKKYSIEGADTAKIRIISSRIKRVWELDDEIALENNASSVKELREKVARSIFEGRAKDYEKKYAQEVINFLTEKCTIEEVPLPLVQELAKKEWEAHIQKAGNVAQEELEKMLGMKLSAYVQARAPAIAAAKKNRLVLKGFARESGIELTVEEFAQKHKVPPNPDLRFSDAFAFAEEDIITVKAVAYIKERPWMKKEELSFPPEAPLSLSTPMT